ncbi:MAG: hypothetical protein M3N07_03125 [Pseudomonadota bacterium]|nr:hypothetical protein [Pseudomonadota bacterium]
MKRLAILILLAGCDSGEPPQQEAIPRNDAAPPAPPEAQPERSPEAEAAAAALRRYYALIGERRYREAWRMRAQDGPAVPFEAFAANYERYADYRATVGVPRGAVEAEGKLWVQIPVQLYGRMRDGTPFGSVGMIGMRRSLEGSGEERQWKVAG